MSQYNQLIYSIIGSQLIAINQAPPFNHAPVSRTPDVALAYLTALDLCGEAIYSITHNTLHVDAHERLFYFCAITLCHAVDIHYN